jgi:60 kDa SS-A/Ro ribonucleoprotein
MHMANKTLFKSLVGKLVPATNAKNEENAPAYALSPKAALAQYAATGCMNATFYATGEDQLKKVLALCNEVEPEFIAKTAIFARQRGFMKDMPALLCAVVAAKDSKILQASFNQVIDDGKMLRNFVQILRSGIVGRKSLGTVPKKLVQRWLETRSDEALFKASVGQDPSLADVIKMVHPKPTTESRAALYAYLIGRQHKAEALPELVKLFETFKAEKTGKVPQVPFQMLTALELGKNEWIQIARTAPWQMTRMNLNTFARHGVFEVKEMAKMIADRLRDAEAIKKARVFPYQLMSAYVSADEKVPRAIREALQDAMEIALQNVPQIDGQVYICPDVSGSMQSPVTGLRAGSTTAVRCIDVAALVAAAIMRKNPSAEVLPFEADVVEVSLNPRDTVLTNAAKLSAIGGGGTKCSAPLALLNKQGAKGDLVVFVSDNESWVDGRQGGRGTATMHQWNVFKQRNPKAKLACIDIQPYATTQASEREDILNIGGFSDQVFQILNEFAAGRLNANHWVGVIEAVQL